MDLRILEIASHTDNNKVLTNPTHNFKNKNPLCGDEMEISLVVKNEIVKERFVPGMKIGKLGLEKTLESQLIGTNAIQRYEVNAYGKRINQLEY